MNTASSLPSANPATPRAALRQHLARGALLVAPGGYDAITARVIEQAGFGAVYMSGAAVSAAHGFPDFGLLTLSEMARMAGLMAQSVSIPVLADADTGFGNELNVTRTVREYERAGVAGLHIEDQVSPKRCGHLSGKEVVPREEFLNKIKAAVAARSDPDFVLIARTDARAVLGFEEAIERANAALECGADAAFVEAAESHEELARIPQRVRGPCLLNIVQSGRTPDIGLDDAQRMGYRLAILPGLLLNAGIRAFDQALFALRDTRHPPPSSTGPTVAERFERFGAAEWASLRAGKS